MFYQPSTEKSVFLNSQRVVGEDSKVIFHVNLHKNKTTFSNVAVGYEKPETQEIDFFENSEVFDSIPAHLQKEIREYCMLLEESYQIELA